MTDSKASLLRNCKKCNRVFSSIDGGALCSRCSNEADDGFLKVKEYIFDNPTSSIKDVTAGTGVPSDTVFKWIREGRIVLSEHSGISFCERCSTPIDGGRYCGRCINELANGLKSGLSDRDQKPKAGMHIKEAEKNRR